MDDITTAGTLVPTPFLWRKTDEFVAMVTSSGYHAGRIHFRYDLL